MVSKEQQHIKWQTADSMLLPSFQCASKRNYHGRYLLGDRAMTLRDLLVRPRVTLHSWCFTRTIRYDFNSRGYRDQEWPDHDLGQYYWCLGDSLTLGLGMPAHETWPRLLQDRVGPRCINVSMAGASNEWIARKCSYLLCYVRPRHVFILWTWLHRREKSLMQVYEERWQNFYNGVKDPSWPQQVCWIDADKLPGAILKELRANPHWPSVDLDLADEARLRFDSVSSDRDDVDLIVNLVQGLESKRGHCKLHHMFLPAVGGDCHQELATRIEAVTQERFKEVKWVDRSRDFDHFGPTTTRNVAEKFAAGCY